MNRTTYHVNRTAYRAQAAHADRYFRAIYAVAAEMGILTIQDEILIESDDQYDEFFSRVSKLMNLEPAK